MRGQIDSAFYYLRKSQTLALERGMRERRKENMDFFATLHKRLGHYDSALHYTSSVMLLRDSLFDENMARDLAEMQVRTKNEEHQRELVRKDSELQRQT